MSLSRKGRMKKREEKLSSQDLPLHSTASDSQSEDSSGFLEESLPPLSPQLALLSEELVNGTNSVSNTSVPKTGLNDNLVKNIQDSLEKGNSIMQLTPALLYNLVKMIRESDSMTLASEFKMSQEKLSTLIELLVLSADNHEVENEFWNGSTTNIPSTSSSSFESRLAKAPTMEATFNLGFDWDIDDDSSNSLDLVSNGSSNDLEDKSAHFSLPSSFKHFLPSRSSSLHLTAVKRRSDVSNVGNSEMNCSSKVMKQAEAKSQFETNVPYACLNYMAIVNCPNEEVTSKYITQFVKYFFPQIETSGRTYQKTISNSRRVSWLSSTNSEALPKDAKIHSICGIPPDLQRWKLIVPTGLRNQSDYLKLLDGKMKCSFDIDGNIVTTDNFPVCHGTNYNLVKVVEQLIKAKNNSLSFVGLKELIRSKYPELASSTKNLTRSLRMVLLSRPWFVEGNNAPGTRSHLYSICEERKGLPLLTRKDEVPPLIFDIIIRAHEFNLMYVDDCQSWEFYEVDKDGNEVNEESDMNWEIRVRLVNTPGQYKVFVSWFTRQNTETGESTIKYNFGTSKDEFVTCGHAHNMVRVNKSLRNDALGPGAAPKIPSCTAPKKVMDGGYEDKDDDDDSDDDDDKDDWDTYETEFWHALGLYSATNNRVAKRIRNLLRDMIDCIGVGHGYFRFFNDQVLNILMRLPFPRDPTFRRPTTIVYT